MRRLAAVLVGLVAVVAFLLGLVAAGGRASGDMQSIPRAAATTARPLAVAVATAAAPLAPAVGAPADFASVAERLNGAVVNIDAAIREDRTKGGHAWSRDNGNDPTPREGSGSGFVIDPSGYILTNGHVVDGADRITVTLGDGRVFRARVVGIDSAIDVALLQVSAPDPLPVAAIGKSEDLRVGEWVCAIGNPLGYVHSVTVGVVSYLGRKLFDQSLDAFIQTDAAISFGNSGGPLINSRGQVVGITTAISAQAANIGFAIPISQVMAVLPELRERGRVSRGYIGIGLRGLTPDLAQALDVTPSRGALVQDVVADSPAERAGLEPYDVITGADGHAVASDEELIRYISSRPPGSLAHLEVWRHHTSRLLQVKLSERPSAQAAISPAPSDVRPAAGSEEGALGIIVRNLETATLRRFNIPEAIGGVLIADVDPAGPARQARVRRGQVLLEINRHAISSVASYQATVATLKPGATVALLVYDPLTNERAITSVALDPGL